MPAIFEERDSATCGCHGQETHRLHHALKLQAHAMIAQSCCRDVSGALRLAQLRIPAAFAGRQAYAGAHLAAGCGILHVQRPAAG